MSDAPTWTLRTPLAEVLPAGLSRKMAQLGLRQVGGLLAHVPMRHAFEEAEAPIAELAEGSIVSARGEVTATRIAGSGRGRRFEAVLCDDSGRLDLVFFNQTYLAKKIHAGHRLRVQGTAKRRGPGLQIANPTFEILEPEGEDDEPSARDERLRPVYPATEGVTSRDVERAIDVVLALGLGLIEDHIAEDYRRERALPALREAYRMLHAPQSEDEVRAARRRLAYDDLLLLQLGVQMRRAHLRERCVAPALETGPAIDARIRERLPFALTPAQDRVVREIAADLAQTRPTNRLVQGDVGSGKTAVALYAMLLAVASGHQAALLAPTAILAEQHMSSIEAMLEGSKVRTALLTGALTASARTALLEQIAAGEADLVIGTHALLTDSVRFRSLGVAVIDEQHRFGVHQRGVLRGRAAPGADGREVVPHTLVMTATPIPRTLGITIFGDLDVSTIDRLPPGRRPVRTRAVLPTERERVYAFVRRRLERGEQAFVVAPSIEAEELAGVTALVEELREGPLSGLRVEAVHGRLKKDERDAVMARFRAGSVHALVATTVIEVGVDVPNATVMVVEGAERFGLAQLHQLRGRVGRGRKGGVCLLVGEAKTEAAAQRLAALVATNDGFRLAETDLEIRGAGEVFGSKQSGASTMLHADPLKHRDLLELARRDAKAWIARSPTLDRGEERLIRERVLKRHGEGLGLADVG